MTSQVRKTVGFVFTTDDKGNVRPDGTCFFVSLPGKLHPERIYMYCVTAKHVLMKPDKSYYDHVFVRLNKRDGSSELMAIPLTGNGAATVLTHPDPTVDIAIIPCGIDVNTFDILFLPSELIMTKEVFTQLDIRAGDDIFFAGMFVPFIGSKQNVPILRFGKVAMISDEKIPWNGQSCDLYLMETQTYGGNSGSPVFFNLSPFRTGNLVLGGQQQLYLAGILLGYFGNPSQVQTINTSTMSFVAENSGIAAVAPAYLIDEILKSEAASRLRGE